MTKLYSKILSLIYTKNLYLLPSAMVFVGLCFRVLSPYVPVALAQQYYIGNYSLASVEALSAPSMEFPLISESINFVVNGNGFAQSFCPISQTSLATKSSDKIESAAVKFLTKPANAITSSLRRVVVTAYSSTVDQCDSTPFITANGTYVYDGLIACNFLPFHTKVKFPEVFGDKVFVVEDRMNKRHSDKMDIWMPSRELALQFGKKVLAYEVVQ